MRLWYPQILLPLLVLLLPGWGWGEEYSRSLDVRRFKAAIGPGNYITLEGGSILHHLDISVSTTLDYIHRPLEMTTPDGVTRPIIEHQLALELSFSIGLFEFLQLDIAFPMVPYSSGLDEAGVQGYLSASGLGDFRFAPKALIYGGPDRLLSLALVPSLSLPTGDGKSFMGEPSVSFSPRFILELSLPPFRASLNVGYHLRDRIRISDLRLGDEFVFGLGASLRPLPWLDLSAEIFGAISAAHPLEEGNTSPVEVLGAVKFRIIKELWFTLASGAGITDGYGTPRFRLLSSLRWGL